MIVHSRDPGLWLYETGDTEVAEVRVTLDWARTYLVRPHPELGRKGPVCPYAQGALSRGSFYQRVVRGRPASAAEIVARAEPYCAWFLELAPRERPDALFTTVLLLFPDLADHALLDDAQALLRDAFAPDALMVGEFHPGPPAKPGLWNPGWRPLRSPVPLLGLRHMVATDLPFLGGDPALLAVHERLFGGATC